MMRTTDLTLIYCSLNERCHDCEVMAGVEAELGSYEETVNQVSALIE